MALEDKYDDIKKLVDAGKEKGYLTYDQVNDLIPHDVHSPEDLDDLLTTIGTQGIDVLEGPKLPSAALDKKFEEGEDSDDVELDLTPGALEKTNDPASIPDDDQIMLNLLFLKYVTSTELMKVLQPFIGENASIYEYAPANLLLILDSRRNMRRLMDLVAMFDSDALANQRSEFLRFQHVNPGERLGSGHGNLEPKMHKDEHG